MNLKNLNIEIELKSLGENGEFDGYASVFGELDLTKEVVERGAFRKSLKDRKPVMLWQHAQSYPIGAWKTVKEDDHGLHVEGHLAINSTLGRDVHELLKIKAINGLSIGFIPRKIDIDKVKGTITHKEVDLWEISLVTFPALPSARIENVKNWDGELPTIRELEDYLREAGISRNHAKIIVGHGLKAIHRDDVIACNDINDDDQHMNEILNALEKMKNVFRNKTIN